MHTHIIKTQHATLIILLGVIVFLLVCGAALFVRLNESTLVVNCASFSSYGAALKALPNYPQLDHDHDGKPCETLFKKS